MFVVGRVLDPDGRPVPNARVMAYAAIRQPGNSYEAAYPSPIGRAICDGAGHFRLDADRTTSARHHLVGAVATAPGFGAGWVELDPDADQPGADITLRPEQVIEGRLFDVNGRPVGDVRVEVHAMGRVVPAPPESRFRETIEGPNLPWSHGRERPGWPGPSTSDDQGRFTLRGIGRGIRVVLDVDDPRFARSVTRFDTDAATGPKTVTIALEPARIITGQVTDAETGRPIPHAPLVVLSHKEIGGIVNRFEADDQGRFRMNPLSADRYSISVSSPPGRPYLGVSTGIFPWPKGATEHRVDLAMHRGVVIRGRVVEEGSDRPVPGARVSFSGGRKDEANGRTETASDGSFQLAVLPAPGHLVVLGPSDDYVYREIDGGLVREGQPGGHRFYAHALAACDPKPEVEGPEITVPLRRGGTAVGRVIGPDGRPVPSAMMIGRVFLPPLRSAWLSWRFDPTHRVRDGRFEVHGLDPDAEVPIHFFEPSSKLGATVVLSGKSGANGPITVRLEPCGTARARLVDRDGKPVAGYFAPRRILIIVTPGASLEHVRPGQMSADALAFTAIDQANYDKLASDADGRIALPDLIPGANYCVSAYPRNGAVFFHKDITVKPGETIDLGDILVEKPPG
jgi:protocatechuate 3,4-dioxygenase beta subunit